MSKRTQWLTVAIIHAVISSVIVFMMFDNHVHGWGILLGGS